MTHGPRSARRSLAVAALLGGLALPADALPGLEITAPAPETTISRATTPTLGVTGTASFDVPEPSSRQFFLRRSGCASLKRLSIVQGTETGGCGEVDSITPINEVTRAPIHFDAVDGLPLTLDATSPIRGVLTMASIQSPYYLGGGETIVDIAVTATVDGVSRSLGTTTVSYLVLPTALPVATPWSIPIPASVDRKDATALRLSLTIRGIHLLHGYVRPNETHLTIPSYTASFARRVEVALDGGAPVVASLTEDLAGWSLEVPTPPPGDHTLEAVARQGDVASATTTRSFGVIP